MQGKNEVQTVVKMRLKIEYNRDLLGVDTARNIVMMKRNVYFDIEPRYKLI